MSLEKLPVGWARTHISDLCTLNPKHDKKLSDSTEISFVPMAKVSEVDGIIQSHEIRTLGKVRKGYTHFADDDIIWAKITPCMENGKSAIAQELKNGLACGSTEFFVLRSNGAVTPTYLHSFIKQEDYRRKAKLAMSGAVGHQRVPKDFLLGSTIQLPPLPEQKRIANKIDVLQAKSKKAREALVAARPLLDKLRQSILAAAFRGDLTADWRKQNPDVEPAVKLLERIRIERRQKWEEAELVKMRAKGKEPKNDKWKARYKEPEPVDTTGLPELPDGWCWTNTNQLFRFVTSGSRGWAKYYSTAGDLFIRIGNLGRDNIDINLSDIQYVQPPEGTEGTRTQVRPNDILISITADVGITSIVPDELPTAYINQHIALSRPATALNARYLAWFISSQNGQKQFEELKRGATKAGLGLDDIRSVMVSLPTYMEQCEIVRQIEKQFLNVAKIKQTIERCQEDTKQLDQSILAKAFRGELVPQDPNDEPASILLERIKVERATQKPKRKQKKSKKKGVAK